MARADHGVAIEDGAGLAIDLVEHLCAALGALGVREGLVVRVFGPELPLLDGGAARWVAALGALGLASSPPRSRVTRAATLEVGDARYELAPGDGPALEVHVAFDHPAIGAQRAAWEGDAGDFARRIAPARTFGFARDALALQAAGRARGVDLASTLVFDDVGVVAGCAPAEPDEPARHKLLDLVGDLFLSGGPPRGRVVAHRPGHAATHAMVRRARDEGILAPCE